MNRLDVGDIITRDDWDAPYMVREVLEGVDYYRLLNMKSNELCKWYYPADFEGVTIRRAEPDSKTPIERKIAFMYSRWEKRNEPKPTW